MVVLYFIELFCKVIVLFIFLVKYYCILFDKGYNSILIKICKDLLLFIFSLFEVCELIVYILGVFEK